MITFFSHLGKSWVAKVIFILLGISMMAFWGLGGLMNTSLSSNNTAIEVGGDSISMKQLSLAFDQERQKMSAMMGGQYLSPELAMQNGLLMKAVQALVIGQVQAQVQKDLGLTASDKAVQKYVERNPAFLDALGNFDKNIFYAYLAQTRMSETALAKELKNELAMQHLTGSIIDLGYNPTGLTNLFYRFKNEKRSITGMLIEADKIQITKEPTDEDLKSYYEAYAEQFILPEYRSVSLVSITPSNTADKINVSAADIDTVYAEKKGTFGTPEKRELDQMLFTSKEKAAEALKGLTAGNFRQIAKEKAGQTEAQTDFGWATKDEMVTELSDPVFKAAKGSLIGPINSSLGWHVVLIKDIKAGTQPNEVAIKAEIKKQLVAEQAYGTMDETVKKFEDALGSGKSLNEAAQEIGLSIKNIGFIDMSGTQKDGTLLPDDLKSTALLQNIFTLGQGETSSIIEHGTGYMVARVDEITPSAPKAFEASKPALKKLWVAEQQKAKLQTVANEVLSRTQKGNSLETQGAFGNFKTVEEKNVTRDKISKLPIEIIQVAFEQDSGAKNAKSTPTKNGFFISVVENIVSANPANDEFGLNVVKQNLKTQTGEGMANEVMGAYADNLGVKVNTKEIEEAFSSYAKTAE